MELRSCSAVLLMGFALAAVPAGAQQVGTATAVNPLSETTAPGAATVTLTVGAHIVHKERIHTTPTGTVQLLFLDKSTLSIAPNTSILIDEYVYNPDGSGHMLASLTGGALRFVGGALSHEGEASIATPAAAIGIRGGTVPVPSGKNGARVIDHFGVMTIHNGAGTVVLSRPDFAVTILDWNTPPGEPERVEKTEIEHYLRLLTSKYGEDGGVPGLKNVTIGACGIIGLRSNNCPNTPWVPTDTAESDAFQLIIQATQQGTGRTRHPCVGRNC